MGVLFMIKFVQNPLVSNEGLNSASIDGSLS